MLKIAKLIICKTCFFCKRYLFAIDWMLKTINIGFVFQLKEMIIKATSQFGKVKADSSN